MKISEQSYCEKEWSGRERHLCEGYEGADQVSQGVHAQGSWPWQRRDKKKGAPLS